MRYPSVADIAADILREVDAERQVKCAEQQIISAHEGLPATEVGHYMAKIAATLRGLPDDPPVTVEDLANFMEQTG